MGMSKLISILFLFLTCALYAQGDVVGKGGWKVVAKGHPAESKTNSTAAEQDYTSLYSIPANTLVENKIFRVSILFQASTGSTTVTYNPYIELGGTKVYTVTAADPGNSVTRSMEMVFYIHGTAAAGASVPVEVGTANGAGNFPNFGAQSNNTTQPVSLATDAALSIVFGVAFSGTTATESLTLRTFVVEELF